MYFDATVYTVLLVLVPILLALYVYAFARKRQALRAFMEPLLMSAMLPGHSRARQWLKALCMTGAVAALVLALMQPQWGIDSQNIPRRGRDLIVLLDVSLSMKAQDVLPNRLEQAKRAVRTLVDYLQKTGGHRLGLVAFAGRASLQSPMTMDYPFFLKRLDEVDTETVIRNGTSIGSAIRQVLEGFRKIEYEYTDLIILTDGEDHNSFPLDAARLAAAQRMNLYTVGIGDASQGHLVPVKWTEEGLPFFAKYRGQAVMSQMNQSLLLEMARVTNGEYLAGGTREVPLDRLYREVIADKPRRSIEVSEREHLIDRYYWFVLAAIILLATDMLLRERKVPLEGQI